MFCLPAEHCHRMWRFHKTIQGRQNCDFLKVVDFCTCSCLFSSVLVFSKREITVERRLFQHISAEAIP